MDETMLVIEDGISALEKELKQKLNDTTHELLACDPIRHQDLLPMHGEQKQDWVSSERYVQWLQLLKNSQTATEKILKIEKVKSDLNQLKMSLSALTIDY